MDTFKIKAFLKAVKYNNFSRAAEEYAYTPSAISHMAHSLSEELGVPLFNRTPTGIILTKEGELLYKKLEAIIEAEEDLYQTAKKLAEERVEHLKIAAYSSISRSLLPEILKDFKNAYPKIKVSVLVSNSMRGWIEKNTADIVFVDSLGNGKNEWMPIMDDEFVAVVPEGLFPDKESVTFNDLYPHPYISTRETIYRKHLCEEQFKEIIPFSSEDDAAVISMVREGIGVAILPRLSIGKSCDGVKLLSLQPEIKRTLGIAYKKHHSGTVESFLTFISERSEKIPELV